MSVRLTSASSQWLFRNATVPGYNGAYTFGGWINFASMAAATQYNIAGISEGFNNNDYIYRNQISEHVQITGTVGGADALAGGGTHSGPAGSALNPVADAWYWVAISRRSVTEVWSFLTTHDQTAPGDVIIAGHASGSSVAARAASNLLGIGAVISTFNTCDARLRYWRLWTAGLTFRECQREAASTTAVRTADLWADWPLPDHSTLTDASGNGRDLSVINGPLTTEDDPPARYFVTGARAEGPIMPFNSWGWL